VNQVFAVPSRRLHNSFTHDCDTPCEEHFEEAVMDRLGFRIVAGVLMVAALMTVGMYAYNLGIARGMAESSRVVAGTGVPVVAVWHPWGFGFGFFPFFPLLFILFWVFAVRGLFWRGGWRGRSWRHDAVPPAFEEWHRRLHAADTMAKPE
jgi:hypothetical protein